jgi:hypothetical protein
MATLYKKGGLSALCGHQAAQRFMLSKLTAAAEAKGLPVFCRPAAGNIAGIVAVLISHFLLNSEACCPFDMFFL